MPIKTLQQQQAQVGRIRIGQQVPTKNGRSRPEKLDRFRFTTPSSPLADVVAERYGGRVQPWAPEGRPAEYEVVSDATSLPVLVPPRPVTQWYEMWSGAGCQRRCDGETETISGDACLCPVDHLERGELAANGRACKATTRLKVMLPEVPGIGVWRLDSHGYYAAIELPQTADFLGAVTDAGGYIKATLALEQRQVKRPGIGVRTFLVPALHVDVTPTQLMAGRGMALAGPASLAIASGPAAPIPESAALPAGPSVTEQAAAQAIADQAATCTSREQVSALWRQAGPVLLEAQVADVDGVFESLGSLLTARGKSLADSPALDADELWLRIVDTAADQPEDFDLDLDFTTWARGGTPGTATAPDLSAYLQHLRAHPARQPGSGASA